MGVGRGSGLLKFQQKKVVFLVSSGKNKFHHFWPPSGKTLEKFPGGPPWKKPFDAHGYDCKSKQH